MYLTVLSITRRRWFDEASQFLFLGPMQPDNAMLSYQPCLELLMIQYSIARG